MSSLASPAAKSSPCLNCAPRIDQNGLTTCPVKCKHLWDMRLYNWAQTIYMLWRKRRGGSMTLLYVGITGNAYFRIQQHKAQKSWWPQVTHVGIKTVDTREEAKNWEKLWIRELGPNYNVVHNTDRAASQR